MDSFDHYFDFNGDNPPTYKSEGRQYGWTDTSGLYEHVYNYNTIIHDALESGTGRAFKLDSKNYTDATKDDFPDTDTIVIGFHAYCGASWTGYPILRISDKYGFTQITLSGTSGRRLQVFRGEDNSAHLLGRAGVGTALHHHWQFIEMKVHFDFNNGYIKVKVNGDTVINETGIRTTTSAYEWYMNKIQFGKLQTMWIDNFYITDGEIDTPKTDSEGFLGPISIQNLMPNGNNGPNQWTTFGSVNAWENVDDKGSQNSTLDNTYNYTGTTGDTESYTFEDLPTAGGTWSVIALQSAVRTQKVDDVDTEHLDITTGSNVSNDNIITEHTSSTLILSLIHI